MTVLCNFQESWMEAKAVRLAGAESENHFDSFKVYKNIGSKEVYNYVHLLEKLLGRIWKRQHIEIPNEEVSVANTKEPKEILSKEYGSQILSVGYMVKTYEYKGNNYVKILLLNEFKSSIKQI